MQELNKKYKYYNNSMYIYLRHRHHLSESTHFDSRIKILAALTHFPLIVRLPKLNMSHFFCLQLSSLKSGSKNSEGMAISFNGTNGEHGVPESSSLLSSDPTEYNIILAIAWMEII